MPTLNAMLTLEQRRHRNQLISTIDVTGFVSVMVVLLFLIMGPTSIIDGQYPNVDLPHVFLPSKMRGAMREDAIMVGITKDGRLWFGNEKIELTQFPVKLQDAVKNGSPPIVYFKVDARARYRYVKDVLDAVQTSGLEKIVFLVEQRRTGQNQ